MTALAEPEQRCEICGAPARHTNPEMCKNYHVMKKEPEKRYVITESDIQKLLWWIENLGLKPAEDCLNEICQHPYPEQCPHWECIEHSDGMEWCCNKKAKIHNGKDIKAIENYIYSSMNHTPEWEKAERAYQNILSSCPQDTHAQQRIADVIKKLEKRKAQTKDELVVAYLSDAIALLREESR